MIELTPVVRIPLVDVTQITFASSPFLADKPHNQVHITL